MLKIVLGAYAFLTLFVVLPKLYILWRSLRLVPTKHTPTKIKPAISIHIACYQEPPELVIKTVKSILALKSSFLEEVIIIDNNTSDPKLWQPLRKFAANHSRARFIHQEGVKGYKAGALNISLAQTSPKATHIMVVDADYELLPQALDQVALAIKRRPSVSLFQYPQAYHRESVFPDLALHYQQYFAVFMQGSRPSWSLATGTLSVISIAALNQLGGWSTSSLTEDALMGVLLQLQGAQIAYQPERIGQGQLPLTLLDLKKQRLRWAEGNMQVLVQTGAQLLQSSMLKVRQKVVILAQLLGWIDSWFVGWIAACLAMLVYYDTHSELALQLAQSFAALSLVDLAQLMARYLLAPTTYGRYSLSDRLRAWSLHTVLGYEHYFGAVKAFLPENSGFRRTNKFLKKLETWISPSLMPQVFIALLSAVIGLMIQDSLLVSAYFLAIAGLQAGILPLNTKYVAVYQDLAN